MPPGSSNNPFESTRSSAYSCELAWVTSVGATALRTAWLFCDGSMKLYEPVSTAFRIPWKVGTPLMVRRRVSTMPTTLTL